MSLNELLTGLSAIVWGPVMIVLLVGTGLYLTIRLGFPQFKYLWHSVRCISGKYDRPEESGDITHFQALAAALSATIGTGNIAGVATAIALGGPGAVFWMWITALVGMATKMTSCALALQFRSIHKDGSASGGPMHYLEQGFRPKWLMNLAGEGRTVRWACALGMAFALFAMIASFGIGNMVQANSVVDGLKYVFPNSWTKPGITIKSLPISYFSLFVGLALASMVGIVILGGIKRIAKVAARIVPFMCVVYILGCLTIILMRIGQVPACLALIVKHAFTPFAAGGAATGIMVSQAIRFGVARGVFSNESGLGSAPIAHAAAKTREMAREGFVAMLGPFIDTLIICTMTAMTILVTNSHTSGLTSSSLTAHAFDEGLFGFGHLIVGFGLLLFAYSTMISWSYYGDRCAEFLFGPKAIRWYRFLFVILVPVGAVGGLQVIWNLADVMNALMAIPNLLALLALTGLMKNKLDNYVNRLKAKEF